MTQAAEFYLEFVNSSTTSFGMTSQVHKYLEVDYQLNTNGCEPVV